MKKKNKLGQYFTPVDIVGFMINLANIDKDAAILEPSSGKGVFIDELAKRGYRNVIAYEIDGELIGERENVKKESFVSADIDKKFDLAIGNPPYIRWKNLDNYLKDELLNSKLWSKYCNSFCDYSSIFIIKSIEHLKDGGQLIFICPEYWLNNTHSLKLRNYMVESGYFEKIYLFNETPIFDNVRVSTVVFKYVKGRAKERKVDLVKINLSKQINSKTLDDIIDESEIKDVDYITISQFQKNERWLLCSDDTIDKLKRLEWACKKPNKNSLFGNQFNDGLEYDKISDVCDIGNGFVSGLDAVFRIGGLQMNMFEESATIKVAKAKHLRPYHITDYIKYIFLPFNITENILSKTYSNFYRHFQLNKGRLLERYQYNDKTNYWDWSFLRNFNLFTKKQDRIFVPCKERVSNKEHFRFAIVDKELFPIQDVTALLKKERTKESLEYIVAYLNQPFVFCWLKNKGIIKGNVVEFSEKPLSNIPFRRIDWNKKEEIEIHDIVTKKVKEYNTTKQDKLKKEIDELFVELLKIT